MNVTFNPIRKPMAGLLSLTMFTLCSCAVGPKTVLLESGYNDPFTQDSTATLTEAEKPEKERIGTPRASDDELLQVGNSESEDNVLVIPDNNFPEGDIQYSISDHSTDELSLVEEETETADNEELELPLPEEMAENQESSETVDQPLTDEVPGPPEIDLKQAEENSLNKKTDTDLKLVNSTKQIELKTEASYIQQIPAQRSTPIFKTVTTRAEPRKPLENVSSSHIEEVDLINRANWEDFRDEHLLDGGDRKYPVGFDQNGYSGLDTEDTFAEYTDHTGKTSIKPSNEVMIYSPKFASVRTIHKPLAGVEIAKVAGNHRTEITGGMKNRIATAYHGQRVGTERIRVRSRLSGLDDDTPVSGLSENTYVNENNKVQNTYVDQVTTFYGQFLKKDKAEIAEGIQSAITWTRDENPVITASTSAGMNIESIFTPFELVGLEDKKTKGRLKIIKMADKRSAAQGEIVKFSIHFTNQGDRELKDIRIVDNLTPRLEYISESATSDLEGKLDVYDNNEGSLILTFELSQELKGHQSATVTFECRVK